MEVYPHFRRPFIRDVISSGVLQGVVLSRGTDEISPDDHGTKEISPRRITHMATAKAGSK